MRATDNNNIGMVRLLLDRGADTEAAAKVPPVNLTLMRASLYLVH